METVRGTRTRCGNSDTNKLTGSHGQTHVQTHGIQYTCGGTPHSVPHQKTLGFGQLDSRHVRQRAQVALWVNHAVRRERDLTSQRKMLIPYFKKKKMCQWESTLTTLVTLRHAPQPLTPPALALTNQKTAMMLGSAMPPEFRWILVVAIVKSSFKI